MIRRHWQIVTLWGCVVLARAGWTLDHANSVYEAIFNLAYIVGPGIGGLLIATLGVQVLFIAHQTAPLFSPVSSG